jgi:hypothetical protein
MWSAAVLFTLSLEGPPLLRMQLKQSSTNRQKISTSH